MRSLALVLFLLTGCSALQVAGAAKELIGGGQSGGKSIEVASEIVVGDKEEDNDTSVHVGNKVQPVTNQQAESIRNETVNNNAPLWLLLVALLFWELPRSSSMWKWIVGRFTWRKK